MGIREELYVGPEEKAQKREARRQRENDATTARLKERARKKAERHNNYDKTI